jgi:hypothetical protein
MKPSPLLSVSDVNQERNFYTEVPASYLSPPTVVIQSNIEREKTAPLSELLFQLKKQIERI